MKREILFRGIDLDGNWIESMSVRSYTSGIHKSGIGYKLLLNGWEVIDPETLGQYTGLKDKNGVKVFEGDIVEADWFFGATAKWGIAVESPCYIIKCIDFKKESVLQRDDSSRMKVIGNIHENPELIK